LKKNLLLGITLIASMAMAACGNGEAQSADEFPDDSIDLIVAYAAGGGTDTGARILQPYLEDELGVTVNIINQPGGAGWVGWAELAKADPDGYTIGYVNSPNIITGYLDPKYNRQETLENFDFLANHVLDPGVIAIKADEDRFINFEEMIEYAQENELTATTSGVGSNDHMAILLMNKHYDTKITPIHTKGASEGSAQVLGGHVDLFVAKVGEAVNYHQNGDMKAIAVTTEEPSPFLEDVPTTAELGYPEVTHRTVRGIAAPAGLPDVIKEKLSTALQKTIENEEQIEQMGKQGIEVQHYGPEEFTELLKEDEAQVKSLSDLLGY